MYKCIHYFLSKAKFHWKIHLEVGFFFKFSPLSCFEVSDIWSYRILHMIMIKLDDLRQIFIDLAMSFKISGSTTSHPIFLQLIARPMNLGWIYPILYQNWNKAKWKSVIWPPFWNSILFFAWIWFFLAVVVGYKMVMLQIH